MNIFQRNKRNTAHHHVSAIPTRRCPMLSLQFLTLAILLFTGSTTIHAQAFGDLLITPMRLVFEGSKRSQVLTLFNVGNDTATYDISMIQYRMNADGTFTEIEEPDAGQRFSSDYIRFFPRTVTLLPKEAQVVRVQFRPRSEMTDGEYRSHMYFRSVPKTNALGTESAGDTTTLAVRVTAIYGITIPIIVRRGELETDVAVEDLQLSSLPDSLRTPLLTMQLRRTGEMSTFGEISVTWQPENGEEMRVAIAKGVAVYTPNQQRRFALALTLPRDVRLAQGRLRVDYINRSDLKERLLAQQELVIR